LTELLQQRASISTAAILSSLLCQVPRLCIA